MDETAKILMASESSKVPEVARKIVEEWRERAKTIERMQEKIAVAEANSFAAEAERRGKKTVEKSGLDYDQRTIEKIALAIAEKDGFAAAISNRDGFLACTAHHKSGQSALELLKARGVGGGSEGFARGKVKST